MTLACIWPGEIRLTPATPARCNDLVRPITAYEAVPARRASRNKIVALAALALWCACAIARATARVWSSGASRYDVRLDADILNEL